MPGLIRSSSVNSFTKNEFLGKIETKVEADQDYDTHENNDNQDVVVTKEIIDLENKGILMHQAFLKSHGSFIQIEQDDMLPNLLLFSTCNINTQQMVKNELDCIKLEAFNDQDNDEETSSSDDNDDSLFRSLKVENITFSKDLRMDHYDDDISVTGEKLNYMLPYKNFSAIIKKEEAKNVKDEEKMDGELDMDYQNLNQDDFSDEDLPPMNTIEDIINDAIEDPSKSDEIDLKVKMLEPQI